jgi:hypothetical protein
MRCSHDGFHAIQTVYDRSRCVLVYFWICEHCGVRLGEAGSRGYRPSYDPLGGSEDGDAVAFELDRAAVVREHVHVTEHL